MTRLSGDEFAIVLLNVTEAIARATADRLIEVAGEPILLGDHVVQIGATVGVSLSHRDRDDPDRGRASGRPGHVQGRAAGGGTYAFATEG